jgi:hypothetical protein
MATWKRVAFSYLSELIESPAADHLLTYKVADITFKNADLGFSDELLKL